MLHLTGAQNASLSKVSILKVTKWDRDGERERTDFSNSKTSIFHKPAKRRQFKEAENGSF